MKAFALIVWGAIIGLFVGVETPMYLKAVDIEEAYELCKPHDGLDRLYHRSARLDSVRCNDAALYDSDAILLRRLNNDG